jgi:hypothetical protein
VRLANETMRVGATCLHLSYCPGRRGAEADRVLEGVRVCCLGDCG